MSWEQRCLGLQTIRMSRLLIIFGLAVFTTPDFLTPDWMVIAGGIAFGGAVSYRLFRLDLA